MSGYCALLLCKQVDVPAGGEMGQCEFTGQLFDEILRFKGLVSLMISMRSGKTRILVYSEVF
jgi:hypothetical protein